MVRKRFDLRFGGLGLRRVEGFVGDLVDIVGVELGELLEDACFFCRG